ncbi:hypothetical protein E2C01_059312 [Portunus trituberculatus]|uniref:Uncharacterized protein n=1 Tax=Portunus trituberculatus TaxID=210409 RepID=A0A5B7H272_PORTR|nr:hypothetical protein [Portunus trituberculatus]
MAIVAQTVMVRNRTQPQVCASRHHSLSCSQPSRRKFSVSPIVWAVAVVVVMVVVVVSVRDAAD